MTTTMEMAKKLELGLNEISKTLPLDKGLFYILYQAFSEVEESAQVVDYLIPRRNIDMDMIKNTKLIFHELIYRYSLKYLKVKSHTPILETLDTQEIQSMLDSVANDLVEFGLEQEKILKLPNIDKLRELNNEPQQ